MPVVVSDAREQTETRRALLLLRGFRGGFRGGRRFARCRHSINARGRVAARGDDGDDHAGLEFADVARSTVNGDFSERGHRVNLDDSPTVNRERF